MKYLKGIAINTKANNELPSSIANKRRKPKDEEKYVFILEI